MRKIVFVFIMFLVNSSVPYAQTHKDYFRIALDDYQMKMCELDELITNFNADSILELATQNVDTIYFFNNSPKTQLGSLTSLKFENIKVINVNQSWLDSTEIYLNRMIELLDTPRDKLDLFLMIYRENDSGLSWTKYNNTNSTERLDYSKSKKIKGHEFPMLLRLKKIDSIINIQNLQYGIPVEFSFYVNKNGVFNRSLRTEHRRIRLFKSYTFIRLDENITVRIIHRGKRIVNYNVRLSSSEKFLKTNNSKPDKEYKKMHVKCI